MWHALWLKTKEDMFGLYNDLIDINIGKLFDEKKFSEKLD